MWLILNQLDMVVINMVVNVVNVSKLPMSLSIVKIQVVIKEICMLLILN